MAVPPSSNAPGMSQATADGRYADLRALGFGIISSRPNKPGATTSVDTTDTCLWSRPECIAPYAVSEIITAYGHLAPNTADGEAQAFNSVMVGSVVRKQGASVNRGINDPYYPQVFNGVKYATVPPDGTIVFTDPTSVGIAAGERFFVENTVSAILPPGPAGSLALAQGTGGSLTLLGTYYLSYTYVFVNGVESAMAIPTSITLTGSNNAITVTAPAAVSGAIWYRVYVTPTGTGQTSTSDLFSAPNFAWNKLGVDVTITNTATKSAGAPPSGGTTNGLYPQVKSGSQGIFISGGASGTTAAGADNNGESFLGGADHLYDPNNIAGRSTQSGLYTPWAILGKAADGKRHVSVAVYGDSISFGTGDNAFSFGGTGFVRRAFNGQQNNLYYQVNSLSPIFGFVNNSQGGETEQALANLNCSGHRLQWLKYATHMLDCEGTNDVNAAGSGAGTWYTYAQAVYAIAASQGVYYLKTTITPRTVSTDGWLTLANQSITSGLIEAQRRQVNNLIMNATGQVAVLAETPYRVQATVLPATNSYSGGDGTANQFTPSYPLLQGSETVLVNGVAKVVTTDYTYIGTSSINGQSFADGIQFNSAPSNGATVTIAYTKPAGIGAWGSWSLGGLDTATGLEVNGSGVTTPNGGFWAAPGSGVLQSSPTTVGSSSSITDTTITGVTQDQYRGYMMQILSDSGNPSAVGLAVPVFSNTASGGGGVTFRTTSFSSTPTTSAVYQLYLGNQCGDGIHPSPHGHLLMAQALANAQNQFRVNSLV